MAELTVAEVLDKAADLIEPEGAWTQHEYARDANGKKTSPVSEARPPVCFCMLGAVKAAAHTSRENSPAMRFLERHGGYGGRHWQWNDRPDRTQAEVVAKLREAAFLAREQKA